MNYILRALKYTLFFACAIFLIFAIVYLTSNNEDGVTFMQLIQTSGWKQLIAFVVIMGFIYPLIGFSEREVYTNNNFEKNKEAIIEVFGISGFELKEDNNKIMRFRLKSGFLRFMRTYDDTVTLDYSGNPVVLKGLRREIIRLARHVETVIRQAAEAEKEKEAEIKPEETI